MMKRSRLLLATAVASTALALTACGSSSDGGSSNPLATGGAAATKAPSDTIVVGSANFPESELLADIYAGALTAKGVKVSTRLQIGNREVYFPALLDGSIDLLPEYSGATLTYVDKTTTEVSSEGVYAALKTKLPSGIEVLDQSEAQDKDAVVVTKATADKYHLTSIGDLAAVGKDIVLGGPPEWETRPTGVPGLKAKYGITFKSYKVLDAGGPLTVNALKSGQIQAGDVFTTDSNITDNNWVVLKDPKNLFAAQNIVPVINTTKATPTVTEALNAVSAKLTTANLTAILKDVQINKKDPKTVAQAWLSTNGLA